MRVDDFDFDLPRQAIADRPASPRDAARLLHVRGDAFVDCGVRDLPRLLRRGDRLVVNDTRVIPARLKGRRGQAEVEVTLHQRLAADSWKAFARPAKKLRTGDRIEVADGFAATVSAKGDAGEVELTFDRGDAALMAALEAFGRLPLPPYIRKGEADARDRSDYQTAFARAEGAVAAPTAGLHFTPELLAALDAAGVGLTALTLHVGAGTFLPVKVEDTADHRMHAEHGVVTAEAAAAINATRCAGGRVVAVGTTALRLLESAADEDGTVRPFDTSTAIFITPGYRFRCVDVLMTNFHLPRSTLFMLVAAFSGLERMRRAYAHAIAAGYRFYSYGDACLLERDDG
ncbi:MAG: tRNA preQ1(34) S-adenosylmethionine ribosyltransferase-isomerase QueA [Magnetospirillum sp.]|nr:tRNA preQ1(34) S-adenosylmethionine ribosyltransferase-isomerase QueA [Magnetospirillum sp.]